MKRFLLIAFSLLSFCGFSQSIKWYPAPATSSNVYATNILNFGSSLNNAVVYIKFGSTNSGSATLNINSLGAKVLRVWNGSSWVVMGGVEIETDKVYRIDYDAADGYMKVNRYGAGGGGGGSGTVNSGTANQWTYYASSGTTVSGLSVTASRLVVTDGSGLPSASATTSTEAGYLSGVTSAIQTQLNAKQATLVSGTNIKTVNGATLLGSGDVGTIDIAHGGTNATTANSALNNLLPSQASANGKVLQSNGTDASWVTPSSGFSNPMTTQGDIIYGGSAGAGTRLAGATGILHSTGAFAPTWSAVDLASGDVTGILGSANGGAGSVNGLLKANGSGTVSQATSGTDYVTPSGSITGSSGSVANVLTVDNSSLQLSSGTTYDGSAAKTISVKTSGITNGMLAGSIDLTTKVTGSLPIANGGTNSTTANGALNNLLPSQGGNSGKFLTTDGTNSSWSVNGASLTGIPESGVTNLTSDLAAKAPLIKSYNTQSSSYTLVLTDQTLGLTEVQISNASSNNLTVPPNSSVAFPIGTVIYYRQTGAGLTTFVQGSGVTITATSGLLTSPGQNYQSILSKTGTNTWTLDNGAPPLSSSDISTALGYTPLSSTTAWLTASGGALSGANSISNISSTNTLTFLSTGLGVTPTAGVGLYLNTNDAATAGAQKIGGILSLGGNGWKTNTTAASQPTRWDFYNLPVQGANNPTSTLVIASSINGSATNGGLTLNSDGAQMSTNANGLKILANNLVTGGISLTGSAVSNQLNVAPGFSLISATGISSNTVNMMNLTGGGNIATSGAGRGYLINMGTFAPSSGTATYTGGETLVTINQSGGANGAVVSNKLTNTYTAAGGDVTDLYIANTNTSIGGKHRGLIGLEGNTYSGINTIDPNSTFEVNGSFGSNITTLSANTTLDNTHHTVLVDATSGNITITLPTASGVTKREYKVVKIDNSANTVTINTSVRGNLTITTQDKGYTVQSNGTSYYITSSF